MSIKYSDEYFRVYNQWNEQVAMFKSLALLLRYVETMKRVRG